MRKGYHLSIEVIRGTEKGKGLDLGVEPPRNKLFLAAPPPPPPPPTPDHTG